MLACRGDRLRHPDGTYIRSQTVEPHGPINLSFVPSGRHMSSAGAEGFVRYIIAGANLANTDAPGMALMAETAMDAFTKVNELREKGYHVRVSTSDGDEITVPELMLRGASEDKR